VKAIPGELRRMSFESGSIALRVDAARCFVEKTGGIAMIGALRERIALVRGEAGTRVVPSRQGDG
jgi:carbamate kinase